MSVTFTKLFSSITESTIWVESYPTRIVWVSMLAMADRRGRIWASIPGLARRAGVTLDECEAALQRFQEPDKYSRTPDNEGRRIEPIDGGWRLLNYDKYRAQLDEEARKEYKRDWDRNRRVRDTSDSDKTRQIRHQPTQAEAEAKADKQSPVQAARQVSATVAQLPPELAALAAVCARSRVPTAGTKALLYLRQMVAEEVTTQELTDAIALARERKPDPEVIPLAYLAPILSDLRNGRIARLEPRGPDAVAQAIANIAAKESVNASH